jgi:hypothetical protein
VKHRQVLDKLAAAAHVRAVEEELARWVGWQMLGPVPKTTAQLAAAVIPPVLARWRCLLDAADTAPALRDKTWVAVATLLHRYGLSDATVTAHALTAVDELGLTPAVQELLLTPPVPLTRRPRQPRATTVLHAGDVVAVQLDGHFHAAYVREVHRTNEYPIVEFYAGRFTTPPDLADLDGRAAAQPRGRARFGVIGLNHLPDPARQVLAVASGQLEGPRGGDPGPADGLYTLSDLFTVQRHLRTFA